MSRLLRAEFRKVATTKLWWGMMVGSMALAALGVIVQIASNGVRNNPAPPLSSPVTQRAILSSSAGADIFSAIVGIILITTEFRHFTSRPTFLLEPRRGLVIAAKAVITAGVGLLYGIACVAVSLAITVPWLSARGVRVDWVANGLVVVMVGALFVVAIFAVVGLGVGVLFRNQVAAVISTLAYLFVVEPLVSAIPVVKEGYRYLPGGAAAALTGAPRVQTTLLANWQGGLLLLGWGVLFAFLGWIFTVRRDIP
jgi:ABC-2 type transport system permease protein